ncbi:MAG TPA: hypothetical protein VFH94_07665 [Streptomyces sp.]|nr:hypothetical protein [Streptomyces sp.]
MTSRFVRERRCVICGHRVDLVPDQGEPRFWDSQCEEGCKCTHARCQPFRVFTDGSTDRSDQGPYGPDNQQEQKQMTTPQQQTQPMPSADDFLMGGGGAPTAKFPLPGTAVGGRITEKPTVEQQRDISSGDKKFWSDGNPMMQLVVTVQTDERDPQLEEDDGRRRLFVKGQMKNAIADAVRGSGARGLEVGGALVVTYSHDGTASQRGFNPPKQYTAQYTPAATNALHTPDPGTVQQAAPAPQQYAPPVAQPAAAVVPGLTPEQLAAAMANPATAALLAQQQAAAANGHTQQPLTPGPAAPGDVPAF